MGRRKDSILDVLVVAPWWISAMFAIAAYVVLGFIIPSLEVSNMLLRGPAVVAPSLAPTIAALLGVAALFSSIRIWSRRRLLDSQSSIEEIRKLDWRDFERLIGETFRRKGYAVTERGQNGPDGGVDLEIRRGNDKTLVQCKHWKTWKVGVSPIRELFGVMMAEGASDAIFVVSGQYTREAWQFAKENGLTLLDGPNLIELIDTVRADAPESRPAPAFNTAIPILVSLAIIGGAVWLGNPVLDHRNVKHGTSPGITSQTGKNAAVTTRKQEVDARAQHEQLVARARKLFETNYVAPEGCLNWGSNQKMLECGNDRVRAKRLFLAQHAAFTTISEIDLQ